MFELGVVEVCVEAAFFEEFGVSAFLDDVTLVHDQDKVGVLDGGQTVRHDERGLVLHKFFERLLNLDFGTRVDGRSRFVQDKHRRVGEHYAGDAEQLLLTLRNIAAVVAENGVVAVFEPRDEAVDMRRFRRRDNFFLGSGGIAERDIVADGAFFQPRVLQYHTVRQPQRFARYGRYVLALHADNAAVRVVESHK